MMVTGCTQNYFYVVQRDTPTKPKLTVTANGTTNYSVVSSASDIESAQIKLGLPVVNPSPLRSVTKQSADFDSEKMLGAVIAEKEAMVTGNGNTSGGGIKEEATAFSEIHADYVIRLNANENILNVVKKDTLEILAVENSIIFTQIYRYPPDKEWRAYDPFTTLGFKVNKPKRKRN